MSCDCFGWEEVVALLHQTLELVYKHLLTNQQMVAELEKVQHKPGVWEGTFFWRWPVSVSSLCAALYILIICLASSWWAFVDKSSAQTTADSSNLLATKGVTRTSLLLEQCMHAAWWYWRCPIQTVVRTVKSLSNLDWLSLETYRLLCYFQVTMK